MKRQKASTMTPKKSKSSTNQRGLLVLKDA